MAATRHRNYSRLSKMSFNVNKRVFVILVVTCMVAIGAVSQTTTLPPHPRLLLSASGIADLKARIAAAPWAKASWDKLKSNVDASLSKPIVLPPRGGNWSHNYVCPIHGARLKTGKKIGPWQWEHICPVGPHILLGDPSKASLDFDGNVIMHIHEEYAQQVIDDGLVYQMTDDARYARKAREILLDYAARYLTYPVHDNHGHPGGRGGHVASQSLTEARWILTMAQGADLVWDHLSVDDRKEIETKMFRPALDEIIIPQKYGIHNIQNWENSAIGSVGFLLNDPNLIALAIDDPKYGFRQQIAKGVSADGLWLEGSLGYHFYAMSGMWPLMEAARNCGMDLYEPKFKSLFDGPFALAMPNLMLPNFNDSGLSPLEDHAGLYELAYARFHDPKYVSILKQSGRDDRLALLFGVTNLPAGEAPTHLATRNLAASGYAILERGQGTNATWLALKYGPHGGGHGHPDKNSFILYARGQVLAPDVGTHAYGSPLHTGWDKTTLAHNTLVVDEKSQAPAQGKCLAFGREDGVDYSVTEAGPIYEGVHFTRTVAMISSNLVVFVDQIQAVEPHTFDLAYHQIGKWMNLPEGASWSWDAGNGYKYFTKATSRETSGKVELKTKVTDEWQPLIELAGGEPTQIITGYGLWNTTEDLVPMLVQRRKTAQTAYVWAVSLDGSPVSLKTSSVRDGSGAALDRSEALLVSVKNRGQAILVLVNPHRHEFSGRLAGGSVWRTDALLGIRQTQQ